MSWLNWLKTALRALAKNKLRSLLATVGIVIAVAAVVATVAIGQGAQAKVAQQMAALGSNLLLIMPGSKSLHGSSTGAGAMQNLTREDVAAIERELSAAGGPQGPVAALAAANRTGVQVVAGDTNWFTIATGTTASYLTVRSWPLAEGAMFGREEETAAAKVCVLGKTVATSLFGGRSALGAEIRVKHVPCKVIGVLSPKGQAAWGQDQDDIILMPWTTLVRRIQGTQSEAVGMVMVSAVGPAQVGEAQKQIESLLRQRHHLADSADSDFQIRNLAEMQQAAEENTHTIAILLGAVALISLIVGAIGIANVMLVSVTERTREIGIRMAVGARSRDVLLQFLMEAVLLAGIGGAMGLCLGVGAARLMAAQSQWPALVSVPAAAATLLLAGLSGVVAGFYPALRASRLDPIEALRFE